MTGMSISATVPYRSYLVGIAATAVALVARLLLDPLLGNHLPYFTFYIATVIVAWHVGTGPSVVAIVLGLLGADWFFVPPRHSLFSADTAHAVGYLTYLLVTSVCAYFGFRMRTEQRLAGEQLTLLDHIYATAPIGMGLVDTDLRYLRINEKLAELDGRRPEECIGRSLRELLPEVADRIEPLYRKVLDTQRPVTNVEVSGSTPADDLLHYWLVNYYPVRDQAGTVVGVSSVILDITERKESERAIREEQQRLQTLLNIAPVAIAVAEDRECTSLRLNPAFRRMLGLPLESGALSAVLPIHQLPFAVLRNGMEVPDSELPMHVAAETGRAVEGETLELLLHDGRRLFIYGNAAPLLDEQGQPVGSVSAFLDVTELRAVERERKELIGQLRREQLRLEAVLEHAPIGIMVAEAPSGKLLFGNREVLQIWGHEFLPAQGIDGYAAYHGFHPDGRPYEPPEWPLARAISFGEVVMGEEVEFLRGDGTRRSMVVSAAPIFDDAKIVAGVVTFYDNTERKQAEEALRGSDRRKDHFLAMLAHELRNPLAALVSGISVAREPTVPPQELAEVHDILHRQVWHLKEIVDDLLDISRISRGKIEIKQENVDLAEIADRAAADIFSLAEEKGLTVDVEMKTRPLPVRADATRMQQVIANLLHNALKFTETGGRVKLAGYVDDQDAVIRVEDTGIGIPAKHVSSIFDLFSQVDHSLDRGRGGLGIGLTLVKQITEMHGGAVSVTSVEGEGSQFTIRIPLLDVELHRDASLPESNGAPRGAQRRVLIVDDNLALARMLALLLEKANYLVKTAHDGPTALELARSFIPDVAIIDIGLPSMDGCEVARRLREFGGSRPGLLIAQSGYGQPEDHRRSLDAGFDIHLVKPVSHGELLRILSEGAPAAPESQATHSVHSQSGASR